MPAWVTGRAPRVILSAAAGLGQPIVACCTLRILSLRYHWNLPSFARDMQDGGGPG
jgi:uncharacterized membrane protein YeiH